MSWLNRKNVIDVTRICIRLFNFSATISEGKCNQKVKIKFVF